MVDAAQIQVDTLPSVPFERRSDLPRHGGVYLVLSGDATVLYVGRTQCLFRRWSSHNLKSRLSQIGDVRIAWIDTDDDGSSLESSLICRFKPSLNDRLKLSNLAPISTRTERKLFKQINEESWLRGHTRSQALAEIIRLGMPIYLKRFPPKFRRIENVE